ncbi:hypothetical protein ACTXJX_16415 [Glutamicibacter ardleyensis]|uniref:hypothetical protein n=1 Tax=Glutamicibacter ardleyensis TaxID=225894 RepID=UPI003FD55164
MDAVPDGWFTVDFNGYPVDFQFRNHHSSTLVVTFHGAAQKNIELPWFTGRNITDGVPAKWLALSDASLQFESALKLSWFAGSKYQPLLQSFNVGIIATVRAVCDVEHVIFLGASGGGFAALETSLRFPDSLAMPMNPQTSIRHYYENFVSRYVDLAWSASSIDDPVFSSVICDLVTEYSAGNPNTIAYIQNVRDKFHISKHQRPFVEKLSNPDSLWSLEGSWGDPNKSGHVIPPIEDVRRILHLAAASEGDWASALSESGFRHRL